MRKVPIKLHTANAIRWLGSLYRNPAEAIKEHISNAVDEHLKAKKIGKALPVCKVTYFSEKDTITIKYPYGMSKEEFENALHRIADSAKKSLGIKQIGQLGIGMFSFLQIGKETIAYNDKSGTTDDYLEKMLSFYFRLKNRLSGISPGIVKKYPGWPKKSKDKNSL